MSSQSTSLYLHIPFCGVRCSYCAFNIFTHAEALIPAYVEAICHELRWLGHTTPTQIGTIYFGGGTPSLLTPEQVAAILNTVRDSFQVASDAEISFEANPDSLTDGYFAQLREIGVNRLSLGMQSAQADELSLFARQHTLSDVERAIHSARNAGFENISLDLIYGIPNQTLDTWRRSLEAALALKPDHLSMYALQVEDKTALKHWIAQRKLPVPDDDLAADMYELADSLSSAAGLQQYEISTWGAECRHNLQYWRNLPYLGVGVGAHGYAAGLRYTVIRPLRRYIDLALAQTAPLEFPLTPTIETCETIDLPMQMTEHMITGLRLLREGVSIDGFYQRFGVSIHEVFGAEIERLTAYEMLSVQEDTIRLTAQARLLSNQVFVAFMR